MKTPEQQPSSTFQRSPRADRSVDAPPLKVALPDVVLASDATLRRVLEARRSTRDYSRGRLDLGQVASLLWAAMGITAPGGLRTAPSAGAIYPLRGYFFSFRVEGLPPGFYSFDVDTCDLTLMVRGDKQARLAKACSGQQCVEECAAALLLTAWYGRVNREFGEIAPKLVAIEAGHIGQNWHLQAAALGLGSISIGNFDTAALKLLLPIDRKSTRLNSSHT